MEASLALASVSESARAKAPLQPVLIALRRYPLLIFAAILWSAPALLSLSKGYWSTPQGAQGPIILMTGAWALAWQSTRLSTITRAGSLAVTLAALLLSVLLYVVGRMAGLLTMECLGAFAGLVAILYRYIGARAVRALWVPILYLTCVIPPPFLMALSLTRTLKLELSAWSVELLDRLGYPVAFSGTTLYVDHYEVVMEAACSGLNSLFSLTAIGFFYIFWQRRGDWTHAIILMVLVVPIAMFTNFLRVTILLVLVHRYGPGVLDTFLHPAAGLMMFVVALGMLVAADLTGLGLRGRKWTDR